MRGIPDKYIKKKNDIISSFIWNGKDKQIKKRLLLSLVWFGCMVLNATLNNISYIISCRSVLLVEETGLPGENHRPVASH